MRKRNGGGDRKGKIRADKRQLEDVKSTGMYFEVCQITLGCLNGQKAPCFSGFDIPKAFEDWLHQAKLGIL